MTSALKKTKSPIAAKSKSASKTSRIVSEVDVLIARLKKIRQGQSSGFDIRQAIEDGRA